MLNSTIVSPRQHYIQDDFTCGGAFWELCFYEGGIHLKASRSRIDDSVVLRDSGTSCQSPPCMRCVQNSSVEYLMREKKTKFPPLLCQPGKVALPGTRSL